MTKSEQTERELLDALDRLVTGRPKKTDGRITQENIALEAGVTRATFNRYTRVVVEYRRVKASAESGDEPLPITIESKNRDLKDTNSKLQRALSEQRASHAREMYAARDEIMVLNVVLEERNKAIAAKDRQIAHLRRQLAEADKASKSTLKVVKK